jgi:hypothetical protein
MGTPVECLAVVIKTKCEGSEDGISVKTFEPSPEPQQVEEKLARIFVDQKWATLAVVGKPGPLEKKVVIPETKIDKPTDEKSPAKRADD